MPRPAIGLVLLAAGESRRMGTPKQLLDVNGIPMIRRATLSALVASMDPVVVVCGAAGDDVRAAVGDLPVRVVDNIRWHEGVGSSIRAGLGAAMECRLDAIIVALGDQPLLTAATFRHLAATWQRERTPVVASEYSGTVGAPALFARSMFGRLLALPADQGCKKVILELPAREVARCACPDAAVDIDTPDEYARLRGRPLDAATHERGPLA